MGSFPTSKPQLPSSTRLWPPSVTAGLLAQSLPLVLLARMVPDRVTVPVRFPRPPPTMEAELFENVPCVIVSTAEAPVLPAPPPDVAECR